MVDSFTGKGEEYQMKKAIVVVISALAVLAAGAWAEDAGESTGGKGLGEGQLKRGRPDNPLRMEILKQFDADGDGKLSETERAAAEAAREEKMKERMLERFRAMDADGNKCVSEDEFLSFLKREHEANRGQRGKPGQGRPRGPGGNNGVGNGEDGPPPGNPPVNDGPGTGPGNPGNKPDDV